MTLTCVHEWHVDKNIQFRDRPYETSMEQESVKIHILRKRCFHDRKLTGIF